MAGTIFLKWLINALTLLAISEFLPGIEVSGFYIALIAAALLGLINITLKPVLILFTLPLSILTLGIFTLFINGFLFWFIATFIQGFSVSGFWSAFVGALVMSLVSIFVNMVISENYGEKSY